MEKMDRSKLIERRFEFEARAVQIEGQPDEMWVEGYAARFNSPTVLFEIDGVEYREQFDAHAFDAAHMGDVIFQFNHRDRVMARTRNKTLQLSVDEQGLFQRAKLNGTEQGRSLYADILGGYIDRMSVRFTIAEEKFDRETRTWTIMRVKRLYDVSAVDIPAYDDTSISARMADAEADARQRQQELDNSLLRMKLELKLKLN